jgi:hypothetical protein
MDVKKQYALQISNIGPPLYVINEVSFHGRIIPIALGYAILAYKTIYIYYKIAL